MLVYPSCSSPFKIRYIPSHSTSPLWIIVTTVKLPCIWAYLECVGLWSGCEWSCCSRLEIRIPVRKLSQQYLLLRVACYGALAGSLYRKHNIWLNGLGIVPGSTKSSSWLRPKWRVHLVPFVHSLSYLPIRVHLVPISFSWGLPQGTCFENQCSRQHRTYTRLYCSYYYCYTFFFSFFLGCTQLNMPLLYFFMRL